MSDMTRICRYAGEKRKKLAFTRETRQRVAHQSEEKNKQSRSEKRKKETKYTHTKMKRAILTFLGGAVFGIVVLVVVCAVIALSKKRFVKSLHLSSQDLHDPEKCRKFYKKLKDRGYVASDSCVKFVHDPIFLEAQLGDHASLGQIRQSYGLWDSSSIGNLGWIVAESQDMKMKNRAHFLIEDYFLTTQ